MSDTQPTSTPGNPFATGMIGVAVLFTSVLLSQSRDPVGLYYLGRFLFLVGLAVIAWSGFLWYRQTKDPQEEREPEV